MGRRYVIAAVFVCWPILALLLAPHDAAATDVRFWALLPFLVLAALAVLFPLVGWLLRTLRL